jgi:hypothetical protein
MKNDELAEMVQKELRDLKKCNNKAHTAINNRLATIEALAGKEGELCIFREDIHNGVEAKKSVMALAVTVNGKLDEIHKRITTNQVGIGKLSVMVLGGGGIGGLIVAGLNFLASRGG